MVMVLISLGLMMQVVVFWNAIVGRYCILRTYGTTNL